MDISFPYWKYALPSPFNMFKTLKTQEIVIDKDSDNNDIVVREYPKDFLNCDMISNHFTEDVRIHCRFGKYKTPYEVYKELINKKPSFYIKLDVKNKRDYIYSKTRECNTFNETFCLYVIRKLVGKNAKILDPSCGFMNRFIAALASEAELYHGWEPNTNLMNGFNEINNKLNKNDKTKTIINWIPFEDSIIEHDFYDLALTSPPYFDLEIYSSDSTQSVERYKDYDSWISGFLIPYLNNMINAVKIGGYIAIYIENIKKYEMKDFVIKFMSSTGRCRPVDSIGKQTLGFSLDEDKPKTPSKIRYINIWQKFA